MRELFTIDRKNYIANGTVFRRPSVRGIIIRDGRIAMIHSLKYEYYKFPGGGIEKGESNEEALVREIREESGLIVRADSIKEFGLVRRIEKGSIDDIFIQENYYYICGTEGKTSQRLDDYEADEGFTLEFVSPRYAMEVNCLSNHGEEGENPFFLTMLERENMVLEIVERELMQ